MNNLVATECTVFHSLSFTHDHVLHPHSVVKSKGICVTWVYLSVNVDEKKTSVFYKTVQGMFIEFGCQIEKLFHKSTWLSN